MTIHHVRGRPRPFRQFVKTAVSGVAALIALAAPARAAVYVFANPAIVQPMTLDGAGLIPFPRYDSADYLGKIRLEISDGAVARGHFQYSYDGSPPLQRVSGDVADFISFSARAFDGPDLVSPTHQPFEITLNVSLDLDASGTVTNGSLFFNNAGIASEGAMTLQFSGSAQRFGGTFNLSDASYPGLVYGQLLDPVDTPEPGSLPIVAAGMLALCLCASARRRRL